MTMTPQGKLYARVSDALGSHDLGWDLKTKIREGYVDAGADRAAWDDLAPEVQTAIEEAERHPRTAWPDPADAPEDANAVPL